MADCPFAADWREGYMDCGGVSRVGARRFFIGWGASGGWNRWFWLGLYEQVALFSQE